MKSRSFVVLIGLFLCVVGCKENGDDDADARNNQSSSIGSNENDSAAGGSTNSSDDAGGSANGNSGDTQDSYVADGPIRFSLVNDSGVTFIHESGNSPARPFPAANGSGVALFDFDLDGRQDLYFANGMILDPDDDSNSDGSQTPRDAIYQNHGGWSFLDVSEVTGLGHPGYTAGIAVSDWNNDGFVDLFLNCFGQNVLYENMGDGTFLPVPFEEGIEEWGASASFIDINQDGLLDLYIGNYGLWSMETNAFCGDRERDIRIFCSPHSIEPQLDRLYQNNGDGTFEDVGEASGITTRNARAQGVMAADIDLDGDCDLYVANDLHANSLFINEGDGSFQDQTELSGAGYDSRGVAQAGMGIAVADTNRDGKLDILVTNYEAEANAFYQNLGGIFTDDSARQGLATISSPWVGWGTAMEDLDGDGWIDIVITNGHTDDNLHLFGKSSKHAQPPLLFHNSNGRFRSVGESSGEYFWTSHVGRGLAIGDLDNDGDLDVVVGHQDVAPAILKNDSKPPEDDASRLISVRLVGTSSCRTPLGATVFATSDDPSKPIVRPLISGTSYLSSSQQTVFIPGLLGGSTESRLTVLWPTGVRETFDLDDLGVGNEVVLIEGNGE